MKKKYSIGEFRSYLTHHMPSRIFYLTDNQSWYSGSDPCKVRLSFSSMAVFENPNLAFLKCSDGNELWFSHVKYIEVDDSCDVVGTIYGIRCRTFDPEEDEKTYTLVAV